MKQFIYNIILVSALCNMTFMAHAQQHNNELFVQGDLYVEQGASVYVWGDVHIDGTNGELVNDGLVELEGNFYKTPDAAYTDSGLGTLVFRNDDVNTTEGQMIHGDMTGQHAISNLTIDNGSANSMFSIAANVEIGNSLNLMNGGIVRTDNISHGTDGEAYRYELYINNPDPNTLNLNGGFVEGRLRREVDSGNTYTFPIGVEAIQTGQAEPFEVTFNLIPNNFNILTYFKDMPSDYSETGVHCNGAYLAKVCELGRWVLEPSTNTGTFSYDVRLMPGSDFLNTCNGATDYRLLSDNVPVGDCSATDYTAENLNGISNFELVGLGTVLDIELERIWAVVEGDAIQINWITASETNNAGFDLERSTDGQNFEKIAWIEGQINSQSTTNYNYKDNDISRDVVYYYRLKAVELGGVFQYSPVVTASLNGLDGMDANVFPNPMKAGSTLSFMAVSDGTLTLKLFDESSRLVFNKNFESLQGEMVNTKVPANLASGIYSVLLTDDLYTRRSMLVIAK